MMLCRHPSTYQCVRTCFRPSSPFFFTDALIIRTKGIKPVMFIDVSFGNRKTACPPHPVKHSARDELRKVLFQIQMAVVNVARKVVEWR
ncbi:hypothetical protein CEP52_004135 [Fusarium oligoseptatum]|uniref:Uncharacterized protein n=1 Tax=Fusarium oligoseptatum TaxID=2604345 RepID=A0A428U4T5_9HYPO|nr:hypothetical protein CEP52_004135 [Fusarium oligoseptatum]